MSGYGQWRIDNALAKLDESRRRSQWEIDAGRDTDGRQQIIVHAMDYAAEVVKSIERQDEEPPQIRVPHLPRNWRAARWMVREAAENLARDVRDAVKWRAQAGWRKAADHAEQWLRSRS
jgi:hypothetical protein